LNEEIHADWPEAKIILLDTGLPQEEVTTLVLTHGLHGVLSTDEDTVLARKALRLVHEGQIWINNSNLKALLSKAGTISRNARVENVSRREKEVLEQILKGRKNKEIAVELLMSEQTVKAHLSHIFKKFKVSSRTQLVSLLMNNSHENVHISEHPSSFFST
jgi:DNA-binding NarL/FixJ family response regulator